MNLLTELNIYLLTRALFKEEKVRKSKKKGKMTSSTFPESFGVFGFHEDLASLVSGFKEPSPIQALCWKPLVKKQDVVGIAETGSGKTLAFSMPLLSRILKKKQQKNGDIRMLVVTPTRELAQQIHAVLQRSPVKSISLVGGEDRTAQIKQIQREKPTVVVGTPGRLNDLITAEILKLTKVKYFVLDEADRMLDAGFEPEVRRITEALGKGKRQTVMFSATWPPAVQNLANRYLRKPQVLRVQEASSSFAPNANVRIEQQVVVISDPNAREEPFLQIMREHISERIIIFVLYKKEAPHIQRVLSRNFPKLKISALHGDLSQSERTSALQQFTNGKSSILIATDVAARGLDIPDVTLVINYTFPLTVEDYVHRIGRTGRAGKTGKAITFFTDADKAHAGELVAVLKGAKQPVPEDLTSNYECVTKKKVHKEYGAYYKDTTDAPAATHVKFDNDDEE